MILFNLRGHGYFDLVAYEQYLAGELVDLEYSEEEIEKAVARISGKVRQVPGPPTRNVLRPVWI